MPFAAWDVSEAILFVFGVSKADKWQSLLHGWKPARQYQVNRHPDGEAIVMSGNELMQHGLPVELKPFSAGLWSIKTQEAVNQRAHDFALIVFYYQAALPLLLKQADQVAKEEKC